MTDKLRAFAKKHFPDITDALIEKNYCELAANMENGMMMNGHPTHMWMNKKTGCIETHVVVDEVWLHAKGEKDQWSKYGKEVR